MDDNSIDLTITSPPYDSLRVYNGYSFNFGSTSKELYRITKQGGVLVWIVGDATEKGSETGTSFKQALGLKDAGFNLHDTMIWRKTNPMPKVKTKKITIVKLRLIIGKEEYWGQGEANVTVQSTFLDLNDDNLPFNKTAFSGAVKKALIEAVDEIKS